MRKRRTIYHNDARHNYLWLFEPPISMDQAWTPVDEVAGTTRPSPKKENLYVRTGPRVQGLHQGRPG